MSTKPATAPGTKAAYGSKDQLARLLRLVPYLHAHDEVRLADAAQMLQVSERQLIKDLKVLWMCGLPGGLPDDLIDVDIDALEGPEGDRVIRVGNADYLARPLRLTPTEATALIVALRALRESGDQATYLAIDGALAKLEQAAAEAAPLADPGISPDSDLASLKANVIRAIAARQQINIRYFVPSRDEESMRLVDPHEVVTSNGADYLSGWCHSAEAPRWFRIDRIRSVELLSTAVTSVAPEAESPLDHLSDPQLIATVRLGPRAQWIAEYYPITSVTGPSDAHQSPWIEATLPVSDPGWLIRLALRSAPDVEIVAPTFLREKFHDAVEAARGLYLPAR